MNAPTDEQIAEAVTDIVDRALQTAIRHNFEQGKPCGVEITVSAPAARAMARLTEDGNFPEDICGLEYNIVPGTDVRAVARLVDVNG